MPGNGRAADVEVLGQFAHAVRAAGEIGQQGPPGRVSHPSERVRLIGNHMVTHYHRLASPRQVRHDRYAEFTCGKRFGNHPAIPLLDAPPGPAGRPATGGQRACLLRARCAARRTEDPGGGDELLLRLPAGTREHRAQRAAEPGDGAHRALGLRQVHVPPIAEPHERHRARRPRRGLGVHRRRGHLRGDRGRRRSAPARRHGVSEVEPVSQVDLRQRRLRAADQPPDAVAKKSCGAASRRASRRRRSGTRCAIGSTRRRCPCPAASSSASASRARSRSNRRSS